MPTVEENSQRWWCIMLRGEIEEWCLCTLKVA